MTARATLSNVCSLGRVSIENEYRLRERATEGEVVESGYRMSGTRMREKRVRKREKKKVRPAGSRGS